MSSLDAPVSDQPHMAAEQGFAGDVTIVAHDIDPVRGMERLLTELVRGLARRGHRVTVIARSCELPPDVPFTLHRVRAPRRPFALAYPWFLVAGSLALRRHRRGLVQATGAIVLNRVDVVSVHYCQQVGTATPSRSTALYRAHIRLAGALKRWGERLCFWISRSATFACVSNGVAAEVREYYPRLGERVITIHNGIETESFRPGARAEQARAWRAELGIEPERLVAAFVASEWERKGLAAVLGSLARAEQWELVVAGTGDRERFQALARSLGVAERVHWLGIVRDVPLVYALADAFVLASSYETFSLVTYEAAASALPILATAVNGVDELIEDGRTGLLITPDPEAIAEKLTSLAADPALRVRLGTAAREAVLGYSVERMVAEYDALLRRLAARASRT